MNFYSGWRLGKTPELGEFIRYVRSNPAQALARDLRLSGPCQTVANACTSGTDAIGVAASWIRQGFCDLALAGGADELHYLTYLGFIRLMVSHEEPCRPFDRDRHGLNLGEGAAVLVLERASVARSRNASLRGGILGYGVAGDIYHPTAPAPDGRGLRRAISDALTASALSSRDMACINVHGTGTLLNDAVEAKVIHDLLPGVQLSATKGFTGHTLGAAGALEACFALACIKRGEIPPSAGFLCHDPDLPACPSTEACRVEGEYAISTSLAFGGLNSALVVCSEEAAWQ
jgi:3-oxoacyl-[acyl-carrier-protein] synthase-1/3-oxoacyl-[acyl-carrier-protein] synthase II